MKIATLNIEHLEKACKEYQVKELYVFGSAASGDLAEANDLDFLVVFYRNGYEGAFDQFMGFKESLEEIYQKPVDLHNKENFRNPVFEDELNRTKKLLYAA